MDQLGCPARATLPGPSRRITVEPIVVPVPAPREVPVTPRPEHDPARAPAREPAPSV